jgi:hypothetical protein
LQLRKQLRIARTGSFRRTTFLGRLRYLKSFGKALNQP